MTSHPLSSNSVYRKNFNRRSVAFDRSISYRQSVRRWPQAGDIERAQPRQAAHDILFPGVFDAEARASRLSYFVDHNLVPSYPTSNNRRATWLSDISDISAASSTDSVWSGSFDVEGRKSFIKRLPSIFSQLDFDEDEDDDQDADLKKQKVVSPVQLELADGKLVTKEVLQYEFDGYGTEKKPYQVQWIPDDPANPLEYPKFKKHLNATILALAVFIVSVAASGFSSGSTDMKAEFGISQVTAILGMSLYVSGFAVGALILSPLSEVYGRRFLYVSTFAFFVIFASAVGLSHSINLVLVLRFLAGLAGSFTQAVAPAVIADMYEAQERGFVLSIFTLAGLMGQMLAPIACGFLDKAFGWRSISVLIACVAGPIWIALFFTFPETYAPVLLQRRAKQLTDITGRQHIVKGIKPSEVKKLSTQLRVGALRPWLLLFHEPIVTLLSLFLAVIQGTMFLLFAAYPIVFQQTRLYPQGVASLPFLAVALGIVFSLIYVAVFDQKRYGRLITSYAPKAPPPEARLPPAILGSIVLPIGLFIFAFTNTPVSIPAMISISSGVLFGFGMVLLYMSLTSYLVDSYLQYAASALAATTVLRSVAGAVFPLFTPAMFAALGNNWASAVPAFLAVLFVPALWIFYKVGGKIRSKSKFGMEAAKLAEAL